MNKARPMARMTLRTEGSGLLGDVGGELRDEVADRHHAGALPPWLAPVQASVLNISENSADYAQEVAKTLQKQGLRVESDLRNEKITYKIREHSLQKVPYILVVGDKEKASGAVSVRARGNLDLGAMPLGDFTAKLVDDIARKA